MSHDVFEKDVLVGVIKSPEVLQAVIDSQLKPKHFGTTFGSWLIREAVDYGTSSKHPGKTLPLKVAIHRLESSRKVDESDKKKFKRYLDKYYAKKLSRSAKYGVEVLNKHVLKYNFLDCIQKAVEEIDDSDDIESAWEKVQACSPTIGNDGIIIRDYFD